MNKIFNESFEKFYDKNYIVLPLLWKNPQINGGDWQLKEYNSEQAQGNNIGLITGERSGVICIDIDTKSEDEKKYLYSLLPPLFSGKVGNQEKGRNYFFQFNGEKGEKIKVGNDTKVELLSTGNQTVLPPSIHPDTKQPYLWLGKPLYEIDRDELPLLPSDFIQKAKEYYSMFDGSKIIGKGGRHNTLTSQCFAARTISDLRYRHKPAVCLPLLFSPHIASKHIPRFA